MEREDKNLETLIEAVSAALSTVETDFGKVGILSSDIRKFRSFNRRNVNWV